MDDSLKNVRAVQQLQKKYPDVRIKSVLTLNIIIESKEEINRKSYRRVV